MNKGDMLNRLVGRDEHIASVKRDRLKMRMEEAEVVQRELSEEPVANR